MLQIDANQNGSLEAREVERLLMTIADDASQIITHKTVRSAMDRLDTNKDKRITFDEFIRVSLELLDTGACCMGTRCCWSSLRAATHDLSICVARRQPALAVAKCCKQSGQICRPPQSHSCRLQVMVPMLKGDSTQKWRAAFKQSGFMQLHGSEGECPGCGLTADSSEQRAACPECEHRQAVPLPAP